MKSIAFLVLLLMTGGQLSAQSGVPKKKSQQISLERLKGAKMVEDLIDQFPTELEIVTFKISIVGKGKYSEHPVNGNVLPDLFGNVQAGFKIYIEYIQVKKLGGKAQMQYAPIELIVSS